MSSTKSKFRHGRLNPEVSLLDLQAATTLLCAHMTCFLCTCREREEEGGLDLWPLPPHRGTQTSGPLLLALVETQAANTPIPVQASEVLVVGGEAHHPRLW